MRLLEAADQERFFRDAPAKKRMAKGRPVAAAIVSAASVVALALAVGEASRLDRQQASETSAPPRSLLDEPQAPAPIVLPGFPSQTLIPPPHPAAEAPTALPTLLPPAEAAEGHGAEAVPDHAEHHTTEGGHDTEEGHEGEEGEEGHAHHPHIHGYMVLFFLFGGFGLGCFLQVVQERYLPKIPYTCMLFVTGFILAGIHHFRPSEHWSYWPSWYQSVEMWQGIDPHVVLFVFLPALVFSEAMRLNIKLGKRLFAQVLLLACPGVIIGTLLTAVFAKYVFPYGWSWGASLVFGSILAATDPVAVVALFNTLGVSPRLTMLISGESLLNDGTAIVCFNLMMKMWKGEEITWKSGLQYFFQMTVYAMFLGVAVASLGLIVVFGSAESRYHSDDMIQVAVTVCVGFLCFFLAESEVETSGVLTVVSAGVMFSYHAWPRFVSKETMRTVWEFIEFLGNTVIFLLAGLLFGHRVLTRRESMQLERSDIFWLLALYAAATVIRLLMILVLWPLLNCCGEKVTWQEVAVMTWSGLRGAVGLVLAIDVDRSVSTEALDPKVGSRIMFHVGGMAMLTILINATMCGPLLNRLGFTKTEEIEEKCIEHFERVTDQHAQKSLQSIMESAEKDPRFDGANLDRMDELVPVLNSEPPEQESSSRHMQAKVRMYREIFMRAVQHHYWEDIEGGLIPRTSRVARILLYSADAMLDDCRNPLKDWHIVEETLDDHQVVPCLGNISNVWPLSKFSLLKELLPSEELILMWQIYAALSFIEAHKAAQSEVSKHFEQDGVLGSQIQAKIAEESQTQCELATELVESFPPEKVESVKSRMLAGKLLQLQVEKVTELKDMGLLSEKGSSHILHRLMDAQRNVSIKSSIKPISFFDNSSPCAADGDLEGDSTDSEAMLTKH